MTGHPEALFPLILDSVNEGVFTVDKDFRITSFNAAAESITRISREDALGKPCREVFKASICQKGCALKKTLEKGKPSRNIRIDILNADKEVIPISVSTAVLKDSKGNMAGGVEIFRDQSDIETLRNELAGRHSFHNIVGQSRAMQEIFALIPQVAGSDAPVLLRGPSGTGKELVAQAIHDLSPRKGCPFIRVNCGALPDTLLESELFGYVKGAFTGADSDKPGRFQQADKGTLFLDEIGDISPAFQVKLLRALEEGEIHPLGDTRSMHVNARIICATNRNLEEMVNEGTFRSDLYYRIRVVPIALPALKERREDIPLLIAHFNKRLSLRTGRSPLELNQASMEILYDYDYPGNVRELRNIMERAFVLSKDDVVAPEALPPEVVAHSSITWSSPKRTRRRSADNALRTNRQVTTAEPGQSKEAHNLRAILDRYGWKRGAVAHALEISRTTLWRKMKAYGLE
jgi:PAS domain S-box-containing protein